MSRKHQTTSTHCKHVTRTHQLGGGGLPALGLVGAVVGGGGAGAGPRPVLEVRARVGLIVLARLGQRTLEEVLEQLLEGDHVLVLVDEGDELDHGGAPDVADVVLDDVQQDLVQVLGEQVPEDLVLVGAARGGGGQAAVGDVEDVAHQQQAVVDQVDLAVAELGLAHDPGEPVRDDEGGAGVAEHLLGLAEAAGQLEQRLSAGVGLGQALHRAETLHRHRQVHQQADDGVENLEVVSAVQEDGHQILVENLKRKLIKIVLLKDKKSSHIC